MEALQVILVLVAVTGVFTSDPCADNLVTGAFGVPDDHITASSSQPSAGAERGRLNTNATRLANGTYLHGSWSAGHNSIQEYIQVALKDYSLVRGVMTQGRNLLPSENSMEFVTLFHVSTSMDGVNFTRVTDINGNDKNFFGNTDSDTIQTNTFDCPVFAKYVRIEPVSWSQNISMRFDLQGCQVDQSQKGGAATTLSPATFAQPQTTAAILKTSAKAAQAAQASTTNGGTTSVTPGVTILAASIAPVPCVSDCLTRPDGDYQGCSATLKSCNMPTYVKCSNGILYTMPCPPSLVWDDAVSRCEGRKANC